MKKIVSAEEAGKMIRENCSLMVGGFLRCGTPVKVIEEIIKNKTGNLTLIANDTSYPEHDRGRLIANRLVKKAIVGHIGTNPETGRQMNAGELEVELVPLGTLAERIRCGGAGLGGFLTPTGVGTVVEKGKTVINRTAANTCWKNRFGQMWHWFTPARPTASATCFSTAPPAITIR